MEASFDGGDAASNGGVVIARLDADLRFVVTALEGGGQEPSGFNEQPEGCSIVGSTSPVQLVGQRQLEFYANSRHGRSIT